MTVRLCCVYFIVFIYIRHFLPNWFFFHIVTMFVMLARLSKIHSCAFFILLFSEKRAKSSLPHMTPPTNHNSIPNNSPRSSAKSIRTLSTFVERYNVVSLHTIFILLLYIILYYSYSTILYYIDLKYQNRYFVNYFISISFCV